MTATPPTRLTAVIASLRCGGSERVMARLCNHWADSHAVTVVTFDDGREPPFFELAAGVSHRPLGVEAESHSAPEALASNVRRVRAVRRALIDSAPQVIVSFGDRTNVTTLLAASGLGVPVVVSERTDPRNAELGRAWNLLRQWSYRRAAAIVVVAERGRDGLGPVLARKVHVIPNPLAPLQVLPPPPPAHLVRLCAIGRLSREKGHDILLEALALLPDDLKAGVDLTVVGDGPLRGALEALARRLGVADRVHWAGLQREPSRFLADADIFVLPSRFEGFPNALAEAMAAGRAVVAADCRSGPRELIEEGRTGLLVPVDDSAALAAAIARLARDAGERHRLAAAAPYATARLQLSAVAETWDALLAEVRAARQ